MAEYKLKSLRELRESFQNWIAREDKKLDDLLQAQRDQYRRVRVRTKKQDEEPEEQQPPLTLAQRLRLPREIRVVPRLNYWGSEKGRAAHEARMRKLEQALYRKK